MDKTYKYFLLFIIMLFWFEQVFSMASEPKEKDLVVKTDVALLPRMAQFCPQIEDLSRSLKDGIWSSQDNKWKSYTPSSATKVLNFIGAQWVGVKIGKIICLYKTDEAVAFPLAIEQLINQAVLEPSKFGWSSLTGNRKLCKSTNVADCGFFAQPQEDTIDLYQRIKYNPQKNGGN